MVVIHEIFGMTDWVESVTDEFAAAGYVAIAPDLLSGMGPKGGGTKDFPADGVGPAIGKLPPDQITADLNAVADYVQEASRVQREGLRGGLLVGRRTIVPLRDQPQGPVGGIRVLRQRPGRRRPSPTSRPQSTVSTRGPMSASTPAFRPPRTQMKAAGKFFETGNLRRRRPRLHAGRSAARCDGSQQEGARRGMGQAEGAQSRLQVSALRLADEAYRNSLRSTASPMAL